MNDLSDGYVPTVRILAHIEPLLGAEGWSDENERLSPLTRYWDVRDVRKMMAGEYIAFDFADKVLCLLGLQMCWWVELADVYYAVNLNARPSRHRTADKGMLRCERTGCSNIVKPKPHTAKGRQRFCSEKCRRYMADIRAGRIQEPHRNLHARFECINGHEKTPETLTKRGDCKVCIRERNHAYYEKNRERLLTAQRERDGAKRLAA